MNPILLETWPNFFIVGAPKTATTSLNYYLNQSPYVYMSSVKEPHYFAQKSGKNAHITPITTKSEYLRLFKNSENHIAIGESSTRYFQDDKAPNLIKETLPNSRIIVILRDPVERTFSDYVMYMTRRKNKSGYIKKYVINYDEIPKDPHLQSIIDASFYHKHLERYMKVFKPEQIKVLIFEEFVKDIKNNVNEVLKFLGVDEELINFDLEEQNSFRVAKIPFSYSILNNKTISKIAQKFFSESKRNSLRENIFTKPQLKPKIEKKDEEHLKSLYQEDIKELCKLLGRQLPWTNFKKSN